MLNIHKTIISDFHERKLPQRIIARDLRIPLDADKIIAVMGPRRAGKTFYLYSLIEELRKRLPKDRILYINFEDERLNLATENLQLILDAYSQLYREVDLSEVYFFFRNLHWTYINPLYRFRYFPFKRSGESPHIQHNKCYGQKKARAGSRVFPRDDNKMA